MLGQAKLDTRPHARLPPSILENGCMDYLTTERSFDLQATSVIDVLDLFFYPWVFAHPGNGRRPVDRYRE